MVSSITNSLEGKSYLARLSNASLDVIRALRYRGTKRGESFKKCALEQLDWNVKISENESEIREFEGIKETFLDLLLPEINRKYSGTEEQFIHYLNTFVLLGIR